jgi:uncharacterized membrane protein
MEGLIMFLGAIGLGIGLYLANTVPFPSFKRKKIKK